MKIVLTDAQTVTNGDLDLSVFEKYGEVVVYPLTSHEETAARIADADVVLLNKTVMDAEVLSQAKNLKYIGIFATGFNMIDLAYCRAHGITVSNAGSYSTDAVAQTVFAFLLHHYSRVADYDAFVREGGWKNSPSFSPFVFPTFELAGKTIGIWLILLLPVLSAVLLPPVAIRMLGFVYLVAGVSGPVYCASKLLRTIFDRVNGGPVVPQ